MGRFHQSNPRILWIGIPRWNSENMRNDGAIRHQRRPGDLSRDPIPNPNKNPGRIVAFGRHTVLQPETCNATNPLKIKGFMRLWATAWSISKGENGGDGGIRTLEARFQACSFSKRVPSASRPRLRLRQGIVTDAWEVNGKPGRALKIHGDIADNQRKAWTFSAPPTAAWAREIAAEGQKSIPDGHSAVQPAPCPCWFTAR